MNCIVLIQVPPLGRIKANLKNKSIKGTYGSLTFAQNSFNLHNMEFFAGVFFFVFFCFVFFNLDLASFFQGVMAEAIKCISL